MHLPTETRLHSARHRLAALDRERAELRAAITELERQTSGPQTSTAEGRVELFASLFHGRPDVFATRWQSRTQPGRSGWAPRCANEWKPGICEKPKVKCAACAHRRFVPYSRAEVRRHLEGHQTIGIYPLLADETCPLLAIDLDGPGWREDVDALRAVAAEADIPVLVERSRSGDGAHLWVLFSAPIPARIARSIGSWLLTQAMSRRSISMDSYDRLFPNQDTMPAGGFGNLIALPLQRERRGEGCTVFLDERLEAHHDQWTFLAEVKRLAADRSRLLAADVEKTGRALALAHWAPEDRRLPPAHPLAPAATAPKSITARLSGRLEIPVAGLDPGSRDRLRRTAAFANPVFYEREAARLSTHNTPRVIACHEDGGESLLLPRGCVDAVRDELGACGTSMVIDDARTAGDQIDVTFTGQLSADQQKAVAALAAHDFGVLVAPPGSGKTVMATALIAKRRRSTLILVHRRPLLDQWTQRLAGFLDIDASDIGSPATKPGRSGIDIAMIQTLTRRDTSTLLDRYGHVVIDECHHIPAVSVERLLRDVPARHITGLTATPKRRDGHQPIISMQCGPVRHTLTKTHATETAVRRVLVERRTAFDAAVLPPDPGIQEILSGVAADPARTQQIADDVLTELAGRYPLVLTERREHVDALAELLRPTAPNLIVLTGGMGIRAQRAAGDALAADGGPRIVLATGRYIGEGFDDPRLDTLVLAMPIAWKGTMTQYAGRLHRYHDDKHEVRILDYVDHEIPVLRRMYAKRQRAYAALGYQPG